MRIRIRDCVSSIKTDIDLNAKWSAASADASINRCVAAATECLKSDTPKANESQRVHLHQIFLSMRHAHRAIRELLRPEGEQPLSVNAMPLVRAQIETLYAICLIVEKPQSLDDYLKDGWKKLFIRHLLMRAECSTLPRVSSGLAKADKWIELMRISAGVSEIEKQTMEMEELGVKLGPGIVASKIAPFPTPGLVISRITDPNRKRMLMRIYPDYQFFCGFVHFSPATEILTALLDTRQGFRKMFTSSQVEEMYQKEIAGPAMWYNVLSVVQCCSELVELYPNDIELARCCIEAWKPLSENTFIGQVVWELRTKGLLRVIG
jgi:hypothetical protein